MGSHLLAANFRSFGIRAKVLETFEGMDLGMAHTSGKECFPCQITMGDILHFMNRESLRLGSEFDSGRLCLFPAGSGWTVPFRHVQQISADCSGFLSRIFSGSGSGRSQRRTAIPSGIIEAERVTDLRKSSYVAMVVGDILDRLLWRVRPYENETGLADLVMDKCLEFMSRCF